VGFSPLSQDLAQVFKPGAALIDINLAHKKYYGKSKMSMQQARPASRRRAFAAHHKYVRL